MAKGVFPDEVEKENQRRWKKMLAVDAPFLLK
jgi:hypothetical protein